MQKEPTLTTEDLLYFQEEVILWNKTFGNSVDNKSLIETYRNLTIEEFTGKGEYYDSILSGDQVGELDGLVDMIFTGFFWAVLEGYINPKVTLTSKGGTSPFIFDVTHLNLVIEDAGVLLIREMLIDLLYTASTSFNISGAFDRVLASNYSKAVHVKENLDISEELGIIEEEGRYTDLSSEQEGEYIILKANTDIQEGKSYEKAKIIKSSLFKSPEDLGGLSEFIY